MEPPQREPPYRILVLPKIIDSRGNLTVGEFGRSIPFDVKRYFIVYQVPLVESRGEHAHRKTHQVLICVRGSMSVIGDDGNQRHEFRLEGPEQAFYVPPMIWSTQYKHSPDAVLLVFASEFYDPDDYIRDYAEFLAAVQRDTGGVQG
jgi:hypothetical protein